MSSERTRVKEYFESQDQVENFSENESFSTRERRRTVLELLADISFDSVLDIGCGGGNYVDISDIYDCQYYGLDFSRRMIARARATRRERSLDSVHFAMGDATTTPFPNGRFDVIIAVGLIEYLDEPSELLEECHRVLAPGGILVLQSNVHSRYYYSVYDIYMTLSKMFNDESESRASIEHRQYSKSTLDELAESCGFRIHDYRYTVFYPFPYPLHRSFTGFWKHFNKIVSSQAPRKFGLFARNYVGVYRQE